MQIKNLTTGIILSFAALLSLSAVSCGILPKIDPNPDNRPQKTESYTVPEDSADDHTSEGVSETEEIVDGFEQDIRNELEMQNLFYHFFEEAYNQYVQLGEVDLSEFLDMSSEECIKLVEEMKQAVEERKEAMKAGKASAPEKLPYEITVIVKSYGGNDLDKEGRFCFILKPLAEQGDLSDEEYLQQYPPFMKFGVNSFSFFKKKTDGKWSDFKIVSFYETYQIPNSMKRGFERTVQAFYEEAWKQYMSLEYRGLQDVMDINSPDYAEAEALLKACIEEKRAHSGEELPEEADYRIRMIETACNTPGNGWDAVGTVRFELEPVLEDGEELTEETLAEKYPAFMKFGEHCWSINVEKGEVQTSPRGLEKYLITERVEGIHAVKAADAPVYADAHKEMEETVWTFFQQAVNAYNLAEEADLSGVLDMNSESCKGLVNDLNEAIRSKKDNDLKTVTVWLEILDYGYEGTGTVGSSSDPRRCSGYCRLKPHPDYADNAASGASLSEEEEREILYQFLPALSTADVFTFNWDDGICKIDGYDG